MPLYHRVFDAIDKTFYPALLVLLALRIQKAWIGAIVLLGIVTIAKMLVGRERPDGSDRRSFPSGHSAMAWYTVPFYGWNPFVVAWAGLVSASRVVFMRHYTTDVVAGGILGAAVAHASLYYVWTL